MAKHDFATFKSKLARARSPLNERSYYKWGYSNTTPVADDFTLDEILEIIRSGDLQALRELSRYYYRTNGNYRNNIDFLAHLPLYRSVIVPVFEDKNGSKNIIKKMFYAACDFVDKLDLPNTLSRITTEWLITGVYNGILREDGDLVTIQDLPLEYCRSRFKDLNNLNILEFNLNYFYSFTSDELRREALNTFPKIVQQAWHKWVRGGRKIEDQWVMIGPEDGGISFSFAADQTPLLIASIPDLKQLDDAIKREAKRDENELHKLLIQRMPIENGELVFELEEVADIHASVANMLADIDTVDVLTTFGEANLENLQDSTAASQSSDRLEKYKKNVWDALGRGEVLFNATNSSSLAYSIKKDESLMRGYLNVYITWIRYLINTRFAKKSLKFDFDIIPQTVFNEQDLQSSYFRGAQYGYSKMFAGVAMGIKQIDQLSLMDFENDLLEMSLKMVPLQSSYTTSGSTIVGEEKNSSQSAESIKVSKTTTDITNEGGRPELPDEQKSEKTQANIAAMG